jgi:hypothetical protein
MGCSIKYRSKKMGSGYSKTELLRIILKGLNGSVKTVTQLERDPPITKLAHIQMQGGFKDDDMIELEAELFKLLKDVNLYRARYWSVQRSITQSFLRYMKNKGYLPSYSLEVESLKNALPEAIIKGDERIWVYSFDHYISVISERVGRSKEKAPKGMEVFDHIHNSHSKMVKDIETLANDLLPDIHVMKGKVQSYLKDPSREWSSIHVKRPRIELVKRPIRRSIVIKRPLPLPKQGKIPKKRILKKPKFDVIGPEDGK